MSLAVNIIVGIFTLLIFSLLIGVSKENGMHWSCIFGYLAGAFCFFAISASGWGYENKRSSIKWIARYRFIVVAIIFLFLIIFMAVEGATMGIDWEEERKTRFPVKENLGKR